VLHPLGLREIVQSRCGFAPVRRIDAATLRGSLARVNICATGYELVFAEGNS
jgi:hypothetical protein